MTVLDRLSCFKRPPRRHQRSIQGFTLLEVLVALAIFALAASVLMVSDGRAIRQTARIQDMIRASWLADAQLNRLYAEESFPNTGNTATVISQNGSQWYLRNTVTETGQGNLRKVEVEVFAGEDTPSKDDNALYRLTGYVRRPLSSGS